MLEDGAQSPGALRPSFRILRPRSNSERTTASQADSEVVRERMCAKVVPADRIYRTGECRCGASLITEATLIAVHAAGG